MFEIARYIFETPSRSNLASLRNMAREPLLTASSTQDIGIQLSRKQRTFIHVIDTNIDSERAKIVNDLIFSGCVNAAEYQPRP